MDGVYNFFNSLHSIIPTSSMIPETGVTTLRLLTRGEGGGGVHIQLMY